MAAAKSSHFADVSFEDSWASGGALPFRLVREPQLPGNHGAPQRWSPYGKAWVLARNSGSFQVGDRLQGTVQVQVLEIHGNYIIDFQGQTLSPMVPWVMLVMSLSNP